MATITLQKRSIEFGSDQNRAQRDKKLVLNVTTIIVVLVILLLSTFFLYLSQFNHISSQGVIINELEQGRSELIVENEVWNMRIAKLKSMDVIEKQDVIRRMVTIDPSEIEFVNLDRLPQG
ncbi:MAG: hypothetical protein Q8O95_01560 [bacterium]|nr:hypothetical protein [bacterium]